MSSLTRLPDLNLHSGLRFNFINISEMASNFISIPTISYVMPITNPPSFDIGLDVVSDAPKAVEIGDFIELWIDDVLDATSSALTSTDITNASIIIDNGTLSAGDHDAKARVKRSDGDGGFIYSAFSSVVTGTVPTAT